jgi:molecular chaperone GrpE
LTERTSALGRSRSVEKKYFRTFSQVMTDALSLQSVRRVSEFFHMPHNKDNNRKEEVDDIVVEDSEVSDEVGDVGEAIAKIKRLKKELSVCKTEKQEYLTGWQRAKADFVNSRRQEEEDRKQFIQFAEKNLILKLVTILESFDMAMGNREAWEKVPKDWRVGIEYIHTQLLKILEESGLKVISGADAPFNPHFHAAVENVPVTDTAKDGIVVEVVQKGYELHGKVLKPARVKVGALEKGL